jgi:hypothetical protein
VKRKGKKQFLGERGPCLGTKIKKSKISLISRN